MNWKKLRYGILNAAIVFNVWCIDAFVLAQQTPPGGSGGGSSGGGRTTTLLNRNSQGLVDLTGNFLGIVEQARLPVAAAFMLVALAESRKRDGHHWRWAGAGVGLGVAPPVINFAMDFFNGTGHW